MQFHIGYVVEAIYKNGKPTLELRVRVPTVHGASDKKGVKDRDLPIAKPMIFSGAVLDLETFEETLKNLSMVYIIFESGNLNKPVYFGIKGDSGLYDLPFDTSILRIYPDFISLPHIGKSNRLYMTSNNSSIYFYDGDSYIQLFSGGSSGTSDVLIGTVKVFDNEGPLEGLRVVDDIQLVESDKVFVSGVPLELDGIYQVSSGPWSLLTGLDENQVVSIDVGGLYGGTMLKYISAGVVEVVKKSEQTKWSRII